MKDTRSQHREVTCSKCNGAGLLHCNDNTTWNVEMCSQCNGFGKLAVTNKKPVAYTVDYEYERRIYHA